MKRLFVPLVLFSTIPLVFADVFSEVFSVFSGFDLGSVYMQAPGLFDAVLYMIFFGALAKKLLEERLGKKASLFLGLILGVSLALWGSLNNKHLPDFGPAAGVIFVIILVVAIREIFFGILKTREDPTKGSIVSWVLAGLAGLFLLNFILPEATDVIRQTAAGRLFLALLQLFAIIGILYGAYRGLRAMFSSPPAPVSESDVREMKQTLADVSSKVSGVDTKVGGVAENVAQVKQSLDQLRMYLERMFTDISQLFSALSQSLNTVKTSVEAINEQVEKLPTVEKVDEQLAAQLASISSMFGQLDHNLSVKISAEVASLTTKVEEAKIGLTAKIDALSRESSTNHSQTRQELLAMKSSLDGISGVIHETKTLLETIGTTQSWAYTDLQNIKSKQTRSGKSTKKILEDLKQGIATKTQKILVKERTIAAEIEDLQKLVRAIHKKVSAS